jgi:hypothetical protein
MPTAEEIFGSNSLSSVKLTTRPPLTQLLERARIFDLTRGAHAEDLRDALERLMGEITVARLDAMDRATVRKLVLDHLAAEKITNAQQQVRAAFGELPPLGTGKPHGAAPFTLTDDKPADEPVNGEALLEETTTLIQRHLVLSQAQADTIALWTAAAYSIEALALMPILLITAPTM